MSVATDSALEVALLVADTFDRLEIDYLVGGSFASSVHGEPRATQDVDFVAALENQHTKAWIDLLGDAFYVDPERVAQGIRDRRSFNIIHLATLFKADIFALARDRSAEVEMSRREHYSFADGRSLWVASAEDTVLRKLVWYRLGNEVSDRQWRDVLAVLEVRGRDLDDGYLVETAEALEVADLLERARRTVAE